MNFFTVPTWGVAVILLTTIGLAAVAGQELGRRVGGRADDDREPYAVLQGTLLGFMGLVLAFALSLAVGRYDARRAAVVEESNAIGTSYLRAQTLDEPARSDALALLRRYTDIAIGISNTIPGSAAQQDMLDDSAAVQSTLWAMSTTELTRAPQASAPRLYAESLNETFDAQSRRVYALGNRVPSAVLVLEVIGAALAMGALAMHLGTFGRGHVPVLVATALVAGLLVVTFDLDRPTRGLIRVPDTPLVVLRVSMRGEPLATPSSQAKPTTTPAAP